MRITDEQINAMNAARTALGEVGDACPYGDADWATVRTAANIAEHAIFAVLNYASSHAGQSLSGDQLHNRPKVAS